MNRRELIALAERYGLYIRTYSPGDGVTRYKLFERPADYFESGEVGRALGLQGARLFVHGYIAGLDKGARLRTDDSGVEEEGDE